MQVTFLKDHVNNKSGDSVDLNDGLANYLVRANVAVPSADYVEQVTDLENESNDADLEGDKPGDEKEASREEIEPEIEIPEKVELPVVKEKVENPLKKGKHKR